MGNCHYPCSFYIGSRNIHIEKSKKNKNKNSIITSSKLVNVIPDNTNSNENITNNNNNNNTTSHDNQNVIINNKPKSIVSVVPEILYNDNINNYNEEKIKQDIIEGHQIDRTGLQFKEALRDTNNLILAIKRGDIITVKKLLDDGQEIDQIGTFGSTPLIISCQYSHSDITQLILNQSSINDKIINHYNEKKVSALLYAAMNGDVKIIEKLISLGAEKFPSEPSLPIHNPITDDSSSLTPLSAAIINGHTPVVKFLLDKSDHINQVFNFPIGKSIIIDKKNMITSPSNVTPLLLATSYGKIDIIKELLTLKANWKFKDNEDTTVLHHTCKLADELAVSIIDTFKSYGCSIHDFMTSFDKNGDSPLHIACDNKNIGIVSNLIKTKINVNIQNIVTGVTALQIAVRRRNNDIVKLLLDNKADPRIVDKQNINCINMISKLRKDNEIYKLISNYPMIEQNIKLENVDDLDDEFM